ncbi:hypothetical protein [Planctomicrobium sp. SH664]|uniref:hypothetical protein n=1 Tax=Planctomicrobium sp. SH664 TaxID=3448125 RepID=UPI003F5B46C7
MSPSEHPHSSHSLLSRDTILILSAFLIGLSFGQVAGEEMSCELLMCGFAGCLAYVVFVLAGRRRLLDKINTVRSRMERRLDRHVFYLTPEISNEELRQQAEDVELISI